MNFLKLFQIFIGDNTNKSSEIKKPTHRLVFYESLLEQILVKLTYGMLPVLQGLDRNQASCAFFA
jgi:hypothetical protein